MALINNESREKEDRQRIIIDFIRSNPYCNVESVVQGVKNDISRVTVFKLLHELIENGAVKRYLQNTRKRNARDHKLFVDEGNPLVSVRLELEEFENTYFDLFNKVFFEVQPKLRQARAEEKDPEIQRELLSRYGLLTVDMWQIFYTIVDVYLFRFLFIWSQKISDRHVLQQLHSLVFSKISGMQTRLSEGLKSARGKETEWYFEPFLQVRLTRGAGSIMLIEYLELFKESGIQKEIEPVLDSLWKIFADFQTYVYPEPRKYGLPFKYGEDDWRKLVSLLWSENSKSTASRQD